THDHNDATSHVFTAMVARTFDDRDRAGIAHPESLARHASEIAFTGNRAIKSRIADYDRSLWRQLSGFLRGVDDDTPARQPLADVVVGLPLKLKGHAFSEEGSEALTSCSLELDMDRLIP